MNAAAPDVERPGPATVGEPGDYFRFVLGPEAPGDAEPVEVTAAERPQTSSVS